AIGVELDRPPPHADGPAREELAGRFEDNVPGESDRQEGELRAAGQVPEHHPPGRSHSQHPAVMPDRGGVISIALDGSMGERPVFQGRINLVWSPCALTRNDDSSILAEFSADSRGGGNVPN